VRNRLRQNEKGNLSAEIAALVDLYILGHSILAFLLLVSSRRKRR
jgi:hypothetical protein